MPRKPRVHFPGALYHVLSRGNNRQKTFLSPNDYKSFLSALAKVRKHFPFSLHAFCLMPNHFHLLVEVGQHPLSDIMQRLLTSYTIRFNLNHKRHGHLFEGRYKAILCDKNSYLLELLRYIHLNPVRAKLVKDPAAWPWSGHTALLGGGNPAHLDTEETLSYFSQEQSSATKSYAQFILDGTQNKNHTDFYRPSQKPEVGPADGNGNKLPQIDSEPISKSQPVARDSLENILHRIAKAQSVDPTLLRGPSRNRSLTEGRKMFVHQSVQAGYPASQIARFIQRSPTFVSLISNK